MLDASTLLAVLPASLRNELIECHRKIVRNYVERRWEPAELNGGKLCEVVYTILDGATSGTFAPLAFKPTNMVDACRALETRAPDPNRIGDRSLRILIPRLLPFLYEIRNNRGVGHVGSEVDPNHEDAEAVLSMANWVMAELVRIFHSVSLAEAQAAVDSLVQKRSPLIWEVEGTKRVLDPAMKKTDQTLLLLYSESGWTDAAKLCSWVEYSSLYLYKTRILDPLHKDRMIEYDGGNGRAQISPLGIYHTESELLPKLSA
jgi:hypothetical protein